LIPGSPLPGLIITHAHADHTWAGSSSYLCSQDSELPLRSRLGHDTKIETLKYGEKLTVNSAAASGAEKILLTHGGAREMARWLQEKGYNAEAVPASNDDPTKIDGDNA